ncbi:dihydrofolate reductase family protein [Pararhodobacter sp.]|uniref:dihydrofolate reductase family protein n=1 Tax=Pararhodobacter sp. TaxID=2127056 RepID=UPI002AFE7C6D|nr:dihydrofolate reductase family protein [Pararhodobacter sp.]
MQDVIYDVAVSVDGFICGADGDVSGFPHEGAVVEEYRARLATYGAVVMGRRTYEFGYACGLKPGANPYPHMQALVVSASLDLPADAAVETVRDDVIARLTRLRREMHAPIYLCGGGALAGSLLVQGQIQELRLKRAPILLGSGVRLFGGHDRPVPMHPLAQTIHERGVIYQRFKLLT